MFVCLSSNWLLHKSVQPSGSSPLVLRSSWMFLCFLPSIYVLFTSLLVWYPVVGLPECFIFRLYFRPKGLSASLIFSYMHLCLLFLFCMFHLFYLTFSSVMPCPIETCFLRYALPYWKTLAPVPSLTQPFFKYLGQ